MRVFISYAHKDSGDLANRLSADLQERGYDVWLDTNRLVGGGTWTQDIETALDKSDVVLALVSDAAYRSEVCRAEQLRSLRRGTRVIPILVQSDADRPLHLEPKQSRDFSAGNPYARRLEELLADIDSQRTVSTPHGYKTTLVTAPPLPINHLERGAEMDALRRVVMADSTSRHIGVTGIRGMGGIGKTILAQAICHDEAVQAAFPDGIIWITVGQAPRDFLGLIRQIGASLDDSLDEYSSVAAASERVRHLLGTRSVLVVLDDIWDVRHVEPFRADAPRSRILFTTRDARAIAALGATEHTVSLLTREQALEMLSRWSGRPVDELTKEAVAIAHVCGLLPLALAMIGATMRGKPLSRWRGVLESLQDTDLSVIRQQFPDYPYPTLLRAIQVSLERLEPSIREMYQDLCVFPEDVGIPEKTLQVLWNVGQRDAERVIDQMIDLSLATKNVEGSIGVHDVQLLYLKHVMREHVKAVHERLIDRYYERCDESWPDGPNDGYFFENLAYHLAQAGRRPELRSLLLDPTWYFAKLRACDAPSLVSDFDPATDEAALARVQGALRLSLHVISGDHSALVPQLIARLCDDGEESVQAMLNQGAALMVGNWLRPVSESLSAPGSGLLQTFRGHKGRITWAALSDDGRRAFSSSSDMTIKVWDTGNGAEIRTLSGHTGDVVAVAASADGRRCISASLDGTLRVWDVDAGTEVAVFRAKAVKAVALSGNGVTALSMSKSGDVHVWDVPTKRAIATLGEGGENNPTRLALSQDGRVALRSRGTSTIEVFDPRRPSAARILDGGDHMRVASLALSANGRRAVSSNYDSHLRVWDVRERAVISTMHVGKPTAVAISADGKRCVVAKEDLRIVDSCSGEVTRILSGDARMIRTVALSGDGTKALSASSAALNLWDLEYEEAARRTDRHVRAVRAVGLSLDGATAVSGSDDGTAKIWHVETGEILAATKVGGPSRGAALLPHKKVALIALKTGKVVAWDFDRKVLRTFGEHASSVRGLAVTEDGSTVVTGSWDGTIKLWEGDTGSLVRTIGPVSGRVLGIAVARNGKRFLSALSNGTIESRTVDGELEGSLEGHRGCVFAIAFLNDENLAVSGGRDSTVRLWDLRGFTLLATLKGHRAAVNAIGTSLDREYCASGSDDGSVRLWSLREAKEIASFVSDAKISSCAVCRDNRTIVAGDHLGGVHFLRFVSS